MSGFIRSQCNRVLLFCLATKTQYFPHCTFMGLILLVILGFICQLCLLIYGQTPTHSEIRFFYLKQCLKVQLPFFKGVADLNHIHYIAPQSMQDTNCSGNC